MKLVSIIQYNTIQKLDCTIQSYHIPPAVYNLQFEYYILLQIILSKVFLMYTIWSWLYFTIIGDVSFLKNLNCSP